MSNDLLIEIEKKKKLYIISEAITSVLKSNEVMNNMTSNTQKERAFPLTLALYNFRNISKFS